VRRVQPCAWPVCRGLSTRSLSQSQLRRPQAGAVVELTRPHTEPGRPHNSPRRRGRRRARTRPPRRSARRFTLNLEKRVLKRTPF
jgi:hypothetical protein